MEIVGDYEADGFAHIRGLVSEDLAQAFLRQMKTDLGDQAFSLANVRDHPNLLRRPAFEIYGYHYPPMLFFLWGLTPIMSRLIGRDLLPTYDYFRIYREGDVCRVHSDRPSCEHSLSLTLDYSDGAVWDLEIGRERRPAPTAEVSDDFGDEANAAIPMEAGDAVLYRGPHHRHGRTKPNPNGWSAHLFLHWVDRDGPHAGHGFDGHAGGGKVNFSFR